jgi:ABC-type spermidine/putrescine transport system permease subunit I
MLLVGLFVVGPLALLVRVSLYAPAHGRGFYTPNTLTLANYADVAGQPGLAAFTALFAAGVALAAVLLAYPVALFVRSLTPRWQWPLLAVVLVPKTAGALAVLFGLQRWLPRGLSAALLGEVYLIAPYAVLVLVVQLRSIDPTLASAARGLGAGRWQAFRRITLPLSLPGLLLAGQLGLMWGLGAFLGPLFLGTPEHATLSVEVHRRAFEYGQWTRAAALAVLLMTLVGGGTVAFRLVERLTRRPR